MDQMVDAFSEGMRKIFLAGVGAVALTAEKSSELIDELVKKGELSVKQGKALNEELRRDMTNKARQAAQDAARMAAQGVEMAADGMANAASKAAADAAAIAGTLRRECSGGKPDSGDRGGDRCGELHHGQTADMSADVSADVSADAPADASGADRADGPAAGMTAEALLAAFQQMDPAEQEKAVAMLHDQPQDPSPDDLED